MPHPYRRILLLSLPVAACLIVLSSSPAKADPVQQAIDRVDAVATMLLGIITNFTNVMITPMGISCAARIFRHVVLANV